MRLRLTFILAAALVLLGLQGASTTSATLAAVGPVNPANGFPVWYQDGNGLALELCTDLVPCGLDDPAAGLPDPTSPVSFPDNFPDEAFWWSADADITMPDGSQFLLVLAMEAAFLNDVVADGDQMSFGRVRFRARGPGILFGDSFTVTHPFGELTVTADIDAGPGLGEARATVDIGCEIAPCNFNLALGSGVGPFLECVTPAPPPGFIGDMAGCQVTGSPTGDNLFSVAGGGFNETTDLFAVLGKIAIVNTAPVAVNDTASVLPDSTDNIIDVLANDTDAELNPLTVTAVTQGANGTVAIGDLGANVTYTPDAAFEGPDTFTYTVSDGFLTATATVTVTVGAGGADTIAPVITCPASIVVEVSGAGDMPASDPAIVAFLAGATATDETDPNPVITNNALAMFPMGATMVTFIATDASGNSSQCTATIAVVAMKGDVNGDGAVTITDALLIAQFVAGLIPAL